LNTLTGRRIFFAASLLWVSVVYLHQTTVGSYFDILQYAMVMPLPKPIPSPLSDKFTAAMMQFTLDKHYLSYRLIPLLNQGIILRKHALVIMSGLEQNSQPTRSLISRIQNILSRAESLSESFTEWSGSFPNGRPRSEDLYEVHSMNLTRASRIFLEDLRVRCYRALNQLGGGDNHKTMDDIARSASRTRQAVDEICATLPYDLRSDCPSERVPYVEKTAVPTVEVDRFYHTSFS
jgi:hypothetical protein